MTNANELIVYSDSRNGLGIQILGSKYETANCGIFVKRLLDAGVAQRDGRLKVGDQILFINDERAVGITRKQAIRALRTAAATNQVRLYVQHFFPPSSSQEFQRFLHDERSTDDDQDFHNVLHHSVNKNSTNDHNTNVAGEKEIRTRRSSRRHRREQEQLRYKHRTSNLLFNHESNDELCDVDEHSLNEMEVSSEALQSLINSKFKFIDLVDLLKKINPQLLSNDYNKESRFVHQLSETNTDGFISLKDFERQATVLLGERINLLSSFCSSSTRCFQQNYNELVVELRQEIALFRSKIEELQGKVITCEKSQRLSEQVENEYEDLLRFVYEQLHKYKANEINQLKQIRANHRLIEQLFNSLSVSMGQSNDQQILSELKAEYKRQQQLSPTTYENN